MNTTHDPPPIKGDPYLDRLNQLLAEARRKVAQYEAAIATHIEVSGAGTCGQLATSASAPATSRQLAGSGDGPASTRRGYRDSAEWGKAQAAASLGRHNLAIARILLDRGPMPHADLWREYGGREKTLARALKNSPWFEKIGPAQRWGISDRRPWGLTDVGRREAEAAGLNCPTDLRANALLDEAFDPKPPATSADCAEPTYNRIPALLRDRPMRTSELLRRLEVSERAFRFAMTRLKNEGRVRKRDAPAHRGAWELVPGPRASLVG